MAIQAALTGHLVMSTLHTNDAPSTITRLLDLVVPSYLLTSTVLGVMAQRLVRVLCPACKEQAPLEDSAWELLVAPWKAQKPETTYVAKGCLDCRMTGYLGRVGIYEIMVLDNELRNLITDTTDMEKLRELSYRQGMKPLRISGAMKIAAGITSIDEVMKVAPPMKTRRQLPS
jgi:general secretion pathway protein E